MKLYKDNTKESFSFLVSNTTLRSDNPLPFRISERLIIKMIINAKIKRINNKVQQNKANTI